MVANRGRLVAMTEADWMAKIEAVTHTLSLLYKLFDCATDKKYRSCRKGLIYTNGLYIVLYHYLFNNMHKKKFGTKKA